MIEASFRERIFDSVEIVASQQLDRLSRGKSCAVKLSSSICLARCHLEAINNTKVTGVSFRSSSSSIASYR